MGKRVLILGGGFGGIAAARRVRSLVPDDTEVVLVDRGTHFFMGFRKTGAIIGRDSLEDGSRPLAALASFGIDVRQAQVTALDPAARTADIDGERVEADAILVALGAARAPEAIPGLAEHGLDVYAPANTAAAAEALTRPAGTLVVGIFGQPYTCPPAPFELAILAQQAARANGSKMSFRMFTPAPMSLPLLGKAGCEAIESRLLGQFIEFTPNAVPERVEAGAVHTSAGEIPFDVLFAIPPHRPPAILTDAGLAQPGGWVRVDPRTLATGVEGVWAVGDCVGIPLGDGKPLPKAGELAAGQGEVAAEHIAAYLSGSTSDARYEGTGRCFLEIGDGEAMAVQGHFLAEDGPDIELSAPSAEMLAAKHRFESERLDAWFGPA